MCAFFFICIDAICEIKAVKILYSERSFHMRKQRKARIKMAASSELLTVEDVLKDYPENTLKLNLPKKNIECIEYIGYDHVDAIEIWDHNVP